MKPTTPAVLPVLVLSALAPAQDVTVVAKPEPGRGHPAYVTSRPPLRPSPLIPLPIGTVEPEGWLRRQLELQAAGFHGRLEDISEFLEREGNAWLDPEGEGSHGWEEAVYWLKGFGACAYVLGDQDLVDQAEFWIEGILGSQQEDGWFGPGGERGGAATRLKGRTDLWPNMIALSCLRDWYEYRRDDRVLERMRRYFDYLGTIPDDRFLVGYWPRMRGGDLLESVYWLYDRTGDEDLLALAEKVHRNTAPWEDGVINWHNVNMAQAFGEPTTFWRQSGEERHLRASYRNYEQIRESYGQVPGGMFGGDENCREGYTGPRQAVETCGMVEMMLSQETLTWITGDPLWADRCEDVAFNSLPAATTADLKALRYLTAPNMVLSDRESKSPGLQNGGPMLHMNPHRHRCCQHNFGHGWPYFARSAWYATPDGGLAAVLYGDNRLSAAVGSGGTEVMVDQDTRYPFAEEVTLRLATPSAVTFPLYLRVPGWCREPELRVDGRAVEVPEAAGRYVRVEHTWTDGSTVTWRMPMEVGLRRWEDNHDSVSVDRGPLTYSLRIDERKVRAGGTDRWPAWEIHPTTPWNYGLVLDEEDPASSFEVERREWPEDDRPFTHEGTPIVLRATGRRIPEWQLDHLGLVGPIQDSPVLTDQPEEAITLIPMGAARLRITAFPVVGSGPEASRWTAPPEPAYRATASHCYRGDTVLAVADGIVPDGSGDHGLARHTFWPRKGTEEWIQAEFEAPRRVSRVAVYWFDDSGRGGCRVPERWRLLHRQGGEWHPVEDPSGYGVALDRFNETTFEPVETEALRLEIELRDGVSAGVLEWRIE